MDMAKILMTSAKITTLGLLLKYRSWRHNFCLWRHQQILSRDSNYVVNVVVIVVNVKAC